MNGRTPTTWPDDMALAMELERQLDSALAPEAIRLQRVRAAVLASFRATSEDVRRRPARPTLRRWAMAAAFAATLVAGTGLVAAGSGPGQPFYGVRLAIGSLLLPGDAAGRDRGLANELEDRLTEARAAARAGDAAAMQAALAAYRDTLRELTKGGTNDPSFISELQRHRNLLQGLVDSGTGDTQGLQQALQDAERAAATTPKAAPSTLPQATPPGNPHGTPAPSHRP